MSTPAREPPVRLLSRRVTVLASAGVFMVLSLAVLDYRAVERSRTALAAAESAADEAVAVAKLESALRHAQSGRRAFVLTGDERFILDFDAAVEAATAAVSELNSSSALITVALRADIDDYLKSLAESIALRQSSPAAVAQQTRITYEGEAAIDLLLTTLGGLHAADDGRDSVTLRTIRDAEFWSLLESAAALLSLALLLTSFWLLRRQERVTENVQLQLAATLDDVRNVMQSLPLPLVGRARDGRVTHWSPQAEHYFGWPSLEAVGTQVPLHPRSAPDAESAMDKAAAGAIVRLGPVIANRRNGSELRVAMVVAPLPMADGDATGTLSMYMDATASEREAEERYEVAIRQRDSLLREVNHRIKNNLHSVSNLLCASLGKYPELSELVNNVVAQIKAMSAAYGLLASSPQGLTMADLLAELLRTDIRNAGTRLNCDAAGKRAILAERETVPIALILSELLTNAAKHAWPVGEVTVEVVAGPNGAVEVCVTNSGQLRAGFDFAAGSGSGDGLTLVRALMPSTGASLAVSGAKGSVAARLTLSNPIVSFER